MRPSRLKALLAGLLMLALLPAWLLATEGGLRFALYCTGRLSGGAITVREAHGRLAGDVRLQGLEVATPAATVAIGQVDLDLRLTRLLIGRVQAERLAVRELAVTVRERAPAPGRRPLRVRAPLRLAVEDGSVTGFRLRLASGREWTLPEARFAARWRSDWIVVTRLNARTREAGPVALRGRLSIADDLLQFEDFELTAPSPVRVEGALALTAREDSALKLSWEALRWPGGDGLAWLHSPRGTLAVEGPWRRYAWALEGQAVAAGTPAEVDARGHGDFASLTFDRIRARVLDGSLHGRGAVAWSPALTTDLELRFEAIDPASRLPDWPGRFTGEAALHARWDERRPRVEFDARLEDSQLRGHPFALQARGRTERNTVLLHELAAQSGAGALRAAGALWPRLALRGSLRSGDFGTLAPGLAGAGEAQFTAHGEPARPRVTLRASAQALGWRGYHAARATLDASIARAGRSELNLRLEQVEAGIALEQVSLSGAGTEAAHVLAAEARGAEGAAALSLEGGLSRGEWRGHLVQAALTPPGEAPFTLEEPAAAVFRRGALRLEPACLGSAGSRACVDLDLAAGAQRIAFRIHEFALARLRPWLPPDWTVTGTLSGTAALQLQGGELAALRADLASSAGAIDGDGVRLDYGPGALRVLPDDGRLHAELELAPAGGTVDGEVYISAGGALLDRPMLGDLRVRLPDLAWLPVLSPEIAAAQGSIDADLSVSGTLRGPSLAGRLQVADGRVRLATPGIELTEIAASFDRGRDAPLKAHLSAKSGDGRFTLDGVLRTLQPRLAGEFKLQGEQVLGVNTPEVRAWITPDLTLTLDGRAVRLTGELGVPRADITPRQIRGGGVAPSSDQVIVSADPAAAGGGGLQVESQVRIALGDKVRFEGLGLKTRLEGALTAADEPGLPTTGRGELRLIGGRYKAYGQDLQIETGRLLFNGGPITDPAIDLSAYRELPSDPARAVSKVGLRARGRLEAPEFSLYSEPAMSQEEQLSWLVLGRSLDATLKSDESTELNSAATSLGLTGGDLLAQQLAPRLGFDEVSVGARPGETADLARLTIGKYLSPKLFLSYGVGLFQPGHFWRLQYDLSRRFKLQGESGLNQGGDLLYTIESGGKK